MSTSSSSNTFFFLYSYDFLEVYLPDCGRSKHTIESYRDTLTLFKRYVQRVMGLDIRGFKFHDCTVNIIFAFLSWLKMNGNKETTRNHRLAGMKAYLNYCAFRNVAIEEIVHRIEVIKPQPRTTREKEILQEEQISLILSQASKKGKGKRNSVLLLLLYETAARVSEIVNLNVSDFYLNRAEPFLKLSGKGKKERIIPLVDKLPSILERYIAENPIQLGTDIMFYSMHLGLPQRLSVRSVQELLIQSANDARKQDPSIPEKVHPHMLRRSKATFLYQHGMALEQVSTFLGHSQLETTRIYAKPSTKQLRQMIERVTPQQDIDNPPLWVGKEDEVAKRLGLR